MDAGDAMRKKTVAVLGASPNPERYSNRAVKKLLGAGHRVIPVARDGSIVEGLESVKSLAEIKEPVDTLTLYVGPQVSAALSKEIIALAPRRVIMNPGAESEDLKKALEAAKIEVIEACTLVLLSTDAF